MNQFPFLFEDYGVHRVSMRIFRFTDFPSNGYQDHECKVVHNMSGIRQNSADPICANPYHLRHGLCDVGWVTVLRWKR